MLKPTIISNSTTGNKLKHMAIRFIGKARSRHCGRCSFIFVMFRVVIAVGQKLF